MHWLLGLGQVTLMGSQWDGPAHWHGVGMRWEQYGMESDGDRVCVTLSP